MPGVDLVQLRSEVAQLCELADEANASLQERLTEQ